MITLYDYRVNKKFGGSILLTTGGSLVVESIPLYNDPLIYLADLVREIPLPIFKLPKLGIEIPEVRLPGISLPDLKLEQKVDWFSGVVEDDLFSLVEKFQVSWEKLMDVLTVWNYRLGGYYYSLEVSFFKREQIAGYLRKLSLACLGFSLAGFLMVSAPVVVSEIKYGVVPYIQHTSKLTTEQKITENLISPQAAPPALPKDIHEFSISIPKINLSAKVIPGVDPNNEKEYTEKLKEGVAQAKGSYLPGQGGPVLLFSHSTDSIFDISKYDALFFGVKDLKINDEIDIKFEGVDYRYKMVDRKVISPDDLSVLQDTKADLVLSTCYPPGTNWQRLLVFAKQI